MTAEVITSGNTILAIQNGSYTLTSNDYFVSTESDDITTIALEVSPKEVTNLDVKFSQTAKEYDGTVFKPSVTVYDGDKEVSSDCYTVTYSNDVTVGTKEVQITFSEPYTGTLTEKINITKVAQSIAVNEISGKTYGDAPFVLSSSGQIGTGSISYSVPENNGVVYLSGNTVTIIGAGSVTITATVGGDNNYNSASATYALTVGKKALSVVIGNQEIIRGMNIPTFTSAVSGQVNGDTIAVAYSTTADSMTTGTYPISMVNTLDYPNYDIKVTDGTLTIKDGYAVSFDDIKVENVAYGTTVSRPANPTKDGYTFVGWYLGNDEFDFRTAILGDLTLHSVWGKEEKKEVKVTGTADVTIEPSISKQLFDELFTEEEKAKNVTMEVMVRIDMIPHLDMDETAQKEFTAYLDTYRANVDQNKTVAQAIVFDISVIKVLAGVEHKVTVLEKPIHITINIPEEYQMEGREFFILRNHKGEITLLEDLDDDPTTITIETDRFSNYTLNYVENVDIDKDTDVATSSSENSYLLQFSIIVIFILFMGILIVRKRKSIK